MCTSRVYKPSTEPSSRWVDILGMEYFWAPCSAIDGGVLCHVYKKKDGTSMDAFPHLHLPCCCFCRVLMEGRTLCRFCSLILGACFLAAPKKQVRKREWILIRARCRHLRMVHQSFRLVLRREFFQLSFSLLYRRLHERP